MRLRTDHLWDAGWKRAILLGARPDPRLDPPERWAAEWLEFLTNGEEAKLGDVWILRSPPGEPRRRSWDESHPDWPIVGYQFTCPKTDCATGAHAWDHDPECPSVKATGICQRGPDRGCWDWTGSVAENNLTGSPSLHCVAELGGCGWHGYMRDGEMIG